MMGDGPPCVLRHVQVGKWRAAAQRHEAALAEAAAQLHAKEAQALTASTEVQVGASGMQRAAGLVLRVCSVFVDWKRGTGVR